MRRWALPIALVLSVGVNLGILAALAAGRSGGGALRRAEPSAEPTNPPPARVESTQRTASPPAGSPPEADPEPSFDPASDPALGPARRAEMARRLERLADHVGLAGAERERFLSVQRGMFEALVAGQRRRHEAEAGLRRELVAPVPDRVRIDGAIRRAVDAHAAIETATARAILETREMLDPAQEERYLAVLARLRPRLFAPGGMSGGAPGAGPFRRRRPPGERPFRPAG